MFVVNSRGSGSHFKRDLCESKMSLQTHCRRSMCETGVRLATIKGHSKMCSFTVLGGPGGSENQSVSGVTTICHLLHIELIRLFIVACGMLVHSSSMAVRSCWILARTGTRCRIRRSRASQTCSMGDMSGEYAGHARTGMFSASRNCVQILATWGRALSCCNMR